MKVLILILLFLSFVQSAFLPLNLVLLVLICRSFIVEEKGNYYLAFITGLVLSLLHNYPLASLSLIFLFITIVISLIRKNRFATHWFALIFISLIFILAYHLIERIFFGLSIITANIIWELVLVIPTYLAVRFWEERFIPGSDIKLRVKS